MDAARLPDRFSPDRGTTLIELLVALAIAGLLVALSVPATASAIDASRIRHAAAFVSARFRLARQQAVSLGANVGVVFDQGSAGWLVRVCRDGTRNGLRRADVQSGADPCFEGPFAIGQLFPGVEIGVDPALRGPIGEPGRADQVRLGAADLASFSPLGSCTAGSVFLRSAVGAQFVIRVGGVSGRIRVLWYESASGWRDR
jgi:prepilin-type N-terminal cleavage/methylation domain-containing protein